MEIASIKADNVLLIYHPVEASVEVGRQFKILELPDKTEGLVVQVISNDSLEYIGLQQEIIQRVLEERLATVVTQLNREVGMGEMRSLKIATAKIRKRIHAGSWVPWSGWIPTRNVVIEEVDVEELRKNVLSDSQFPIEFCSLDELSITLSGPNLNMVNVVTGVKGSGKSHMAKHLVLALAQHRVPTVVFDINGEYMGLPDAQTFQWGNNFRPSLDGLGYGVLQQVIRAVYPLPDNSDAVFSARLPQVWAQRREYCSRSQQEFHVDIRFLLQQTWGGGQYVEEAIKRRLEMVHDMNLFHDYATNDRVVKLESLYDNAAGSDEAEGRPIVFDMRDLDRSLQQALVRAVNDVLKSICRNEVDGKKRYPFVFYEEAHFYIREDVIVDIITRGRHIGMGSVFVTNTPQELPRTVFRQLDNLFLLGLTHTDDIRNVSQSSFTDEETIRSFATRMPQHHALIIGNVTSRYPLIVRVNPLPDNVPASGQTRSTWERFQPEAHR